MPWKQVQHVRLYTSLVSGSERVMPWKQSHIHVHLYSSKRESGCHGNQVTCASLHSESERAGTMETMSHM